MINKPVRLAIQMTQILHVNITNTCMTIQIMCVTIQTKCVTHDNPNDMSGKKNVLVLVHKIVSKEELWPEGYFQ